MKKTGSFFFIFSLRSDGIWGPKPTAEQGEMQAGKKVSAQV